MAEDGNVGHCGRRIIIKGVPAGVDEELLGLYLESVSPGGEVVSVTLYSQAGMALALFKEPIQDWEAMKKAVASKTLQKCHLSVDLDVDVPSLVLVRDLPPGVNPEKICQYFNNEQLSGGGGVGTVLQKPNNTYLVQFCKEEATQRVLNRPHQLGGKQITVESFGASSTWTSPEENKPLHTSQDEKCVTQASQGECQVTHKPGEEYDRWQHHVPGTCNKERPQGKNDKTSSKSCSAQLLSPKENPVSRQIRPGAVIKTDNAWGVSQHGETHDDDIRHDSSDQNRVKPQLTVKPMKHASPQKVDNAHIGLPSVANKNQLSAFGTKAIKTEIAKLSQPVLYTDVVQIKDWHMVLVMNYIRTLQKRNNSVDIILEAGANQVLIKSACQESLYDVKLSLLEFTQGIVEKSLNISPDICKMFQRPQGRQVIDHITEAYVDEALVMVKEGKVVITTCDPDLADIIHSKLKAQIRSVTLGISSNKDFLASKTWTDVKRQLESEWLVTIRLGDHQGALEVEGVGEDVDHVSVVIQAQLEESQTSQKQITLKKGQWRLLNEHARDDVIQVTKLYREQGLQVKFECSDDKWWILLTGWGSGPASAQRHLQANLLKQIGCSNFELAKPGLTRFLAEGSGRGLLDTVETKLQCVIEITSKLQERNASQSREGSRTMTRSGKGRKVGSSHPAQGSIRNRGQTVLTPGGDQMCYQLGQVRLVVKQGDLLKQTQVSVLVNPVAGGKPVLSGPLSQAFIGEGGASLQQEMLSAGCISFGDVKVTSGGNLTNSHVLHMAYGKWDAMKGEQRLREVVQTCLFMAEGLQVSSIAFPAIGCGRMGYPPETVAQILATVTSEFANRGTCLQFVFIVVSDNLLPSFEKAVSAVIVESEQGLCSFDDDQGFGAYYSSGNANTAEMYPEQEHFWSPPEYEMEQSQSLTELSSGRYEDDDIYGNESSFEEDNSDEGDSDSDNSYYPPSDETQLLTPYMKDLQRPQCWAGEESWDSAYSDNLRQAVPHYSPHMPSQNYPYMSPHSPAQVPLHNPEHMFKAQHGPRHVPLKSSPCIPKDRLRQMIDEAEMVHPAAAGRSAKRRQNAVPKRHCGRGVRKTVVHINTLREGTLDTARSRILQLIEEHFCTDIVKNSALGNLRDSQKQQILSWKSADLTLHIDQHRRQLKLAGEKKAVNRDKQKCRDDLLPATTDQGDLPAFAKRDPSSYQYPRNPPPGTRDHRYRRGMDSEMDNVRHRMDNPGFPRPPSALRSHSKPRPDNKKGDVTKPDDRRESKQGYNPKGRNIRKLADEEVRTPCYWKKVKQGVLSEIARTFGVTKSSYIVDVDVATQQAVSGLLEKTWRKDTVGQGRDATNLRHSQIQVTSVQRVENIHVFMDYAEKRKKMLRMASTNTFPSIENLPGQPRPVWTTRCKLPLVDPPLIPDINECLFFHGTTEDVVEAVVKQGLDFRLSGSKAMFGQGIYFAESSTKADQYTDKGQRRGGELTMLVVRVLLGRTYLAERPHPFSRPPCMHCRRDDCKKHVATEFYDSVLGTGREDGSSLLFREFVIYDGERCYPEFVVKYVRK